MISVLCDMRAIIHFNLVMSSDEGFRFINLPRSAVRIRCAGLEPTKVVVRFTAARHVLCRGMRILP